MRAIPRSILQEPDVREFALLHALDLESGLMAIGAVGYICILGDDDFPVKLSGVFTHLLSGSGKML